jgi:DNA-binding XRE family transcriptional regulator
MSTQTKKPKTKKRSPAKRIAPMPILPPANAQGYYPAAETLQVIIARQLIERRRQAGLSQAEVAKRAGIRQETVSRLESGKHAPTVRTFEKIDRVLANAGA